ncbi:Sterol 3-beta-glucosyltransferase UGT80B1 [Phytophthora ramorum]|uniref:Sterol 3-beta-glucosyltransferase UGT80B1 n=1 Tax=Phytophthora ramorum TaxID=164328 RepID=UPI0030B37F31|nr:Sterol 3-beta-glucosyltransferase UGT80B1 [Phytophthora ramorum]
MTDRNSASVHQPFALAACGPDGRIQIEFAAEDSIDIRRPDHHAHADTRAQATPSQSSSHTPDTFTTTNTTVQRPPVMRICIIIVGTRGDVQPFLAIAQRLQRDGHRVRLATHAVYRDFVMSHGVEFYPLGGDPKELAAYMVKTGGHLIPTKIETLTKDVPRNREMINEIVHSTWPAVSAADPDGGGPGVPGKPFQAQAIIANPVSYGHIHVAERLGVPLHIMFPQPWVPTTAFPHPLANMPYTDELKKTNYLSYKMVDLLMWQGTEGLINEFRTKVLKLRKIRNGDGGRDLLLDLRIPHAFMWSPKLVTKPADWGHLYDVIGTVTLTDGPGSSYTPSPELERFLGSDGGPIFVGFGSMVLADPQATTKMIVDAALQANVRVLIQSSWSDMAGDLDIPPNVFFIGNCPHDWLMPRVCAVVHHGGAGTTAAGLLAGKPTFIVPFFGDQPFWGHAVVKAGVGVEPCPITKLTTEKLREAFVGLMNPTLRARALDLRDVMQHEDGAGEAVRSFYRHLPTQDMFCDLDHERIATQWSIRDRLKLCDRCALIVSERLENAGKKMVSYHVVDYTARGPNSTLAGASAGAGAFFHEFAGAYTGLVREPVKGFSKNGVAGGAIGTLKGVGCFLVRPTLGLVHFTDRVVTGHINAHREEGEQKHSSMLDRGFMSAIGVQKGLANSHTPSTEGNSVDNVLFADKSVRKQMLRAISNKAEVYRMRYQATLDFRKTQSGRLPEYNPLFPSTTTGHQQLARIRAPGLAPTGITSKWSDPAHQQQAVKLLEVQLTSRGSVNVQIDLPCEDFDTVDNNTITRWRQFAAFQCGKAVQAQRATKPAVPPMNVCLAAVGTWDNGVKQFAAVGLKLAAHGHRVRLAANECFRSKVTALGLEFYPLAGVPDSVQEFVQLIHDAQTSAALDSELGRSSLGALQSFRELVYSLWPAAYGSDPHGCGPNKPGVHFRADALLWHPMLLGHVHVAQRLGIPLQCASLEPLSPTFEFPHVLSSFAALDSAVTMTPRHTNLLTHGVVDATLNRGSVADILTQFRSFIGLTSRLNRPDPLVQWEVPHVYLYNPALLSKPLDWGEELTVAGHVTLRSGQTPPAVPQALTQFAFSSSSPPVIYFGVSTRTFVFGEFEDLLQKIDRAAQQLRVRVIVQARDVGDAARSPYRSASVYLVDAEVPYDQLFAGVAATIHWGEPDVLAEGLMAGKPMAVCGSHPSQLFAAHLCQRVGVGIPPINASTCTVESLVASFQQLLQPGIWANAQAFAPTFDPERAVNIAVRSFYSNLPLKAMMCDIDPTKIARVFDSQHTVKLSLEAYLTVQPVRDDSKGFVPYKPLQYDGFCPPVFSIRTSLGDIPHDVKPPRDLDAVGMAIEVLNTQDDRRSSGSSQQSSEYANVDVQVVDTEVFWLSTEEEKAARKSTNAAYERLVKPRALRKRDKLTQLFHDRSK